MSLFILCKLVYACLDVCVAVNGCLLLSETGRGKNDSGTGFDNMKERPCLLSVDGGHR